MNQLYILSAFVTTLSGMALLGSLMLTRNQRASSVRLLAMIAGAGILPRPSLKESVQKHAIRLLQQLRATLPIKDSQKVNDLLLGAGLRTSTAREVFLAIRLLCPAAALLVGMCISTNRFFWMLTLGGVAYLAPSMVLGRLVKRRREKIRLGIPDAIDLLVICVDAGLGMDQAMLRVGKELQHSHPPIHEEFMQINREQRAGKPRIDAWRGFAERSALQEIEGFVQMLLQTERFGTPIARALSEYGGNIRLKRRQRAEELAAKTTVKIIFPLVLFIFPSLFIVLLGPAGINISRSLASGTQ